MRSLGFNLSGCGGSGSTASGVQWTPSITVPSLIAIKCRLLTTPSIVAMYLDVKVLAIRILKVNRRNYSNLQQIDNNKHQGPIQTHKVVTS